MCKLGRIVLVYAVHICIVLCDCGLFMCHGPRVLGGLLVVLDHWSRHCTEA